jgi:hypothetical protein
MSADKQENKPADKANQFMTSLPEGKSREQVMADLGVESQFGNAWLARTFLQTGIGEMDLTSYINGVRKQVEEVKAGDMSSVEAMLVGQSVALNGLFLEMSRRVAMNLGGHLPATEAYMRLALKAQNNCRATLQTLGEIKNPRQPVVFAKQANLANGPQQVVNGVAHAEENKYGGNKQLENVPSERLDTGAQEASGGNDQVLEAVGAVNGSEVG